MERTTFPVPDTESDPGAWADAIDTTVAQDIVITGQQVAAGDTLVLEQAIIKIFPGA